MKKEKNQLSLRGEKADFYYCPKCEINFEALKCPRCGKEGAPAKLSAIQDFSKDPSYFDYVMKKDKGGSEK